MCPNKGFVRKGVIHLTAAERLINYLHAGPKTAVAVHDPSNMFYLTEGLPFPERGDGRDEGALPGNLRLRREACVEGGFRAIDPQRHRLCPCPRHEDGNPRA